MILGLTGKKQHGKDTVGTILVEEHGYTRLSYAEALKESVGELFGIPRSLIETWKNEPTVEVKIVDNGTTIRSFTFRQFLQRYGTEAHRNVFGDACWVDVVADKLRVGATPSMRARGEGPKYVVTDVRFDNEAAVIREMSGLVVEVYRPQVVDDADSHASEDLPDADLMLYNGDSIENLRARIAQCEAEGWVQVLL